MADRPFWDGPKLRTQIRLQERRRDDAQSSLDAANTTLGQLRQALDELPEEWR